MEREYDLKPLTFVLGRLYFDLSLLNWRNYVDMSEIESEMVGGINTRQHRYPYCIVWTPIPLLTWLFPVIGHMGICTAAGVIRDFAGSYYVSEDNMAFGNPTRYVQLNPDNVKATGWDIAISEAASLYKTRMHNLCCDNCHSMVANALNRMQYRGSASWNMVTLACLITFNGRYVGISGFLKSLLPSILLYTIIICMVVLI